MPKGGAVQAGAVRMSGGRVVSQDLLEGLSVRSVEDVSIIAGKEKDVVLSGGTVVVASVQSTKLSSQTIELLSGWNQAIQMDAHGGSVQMGAVQMSGSRVDTDDAMHGMSIRSKEDVEIAAAEDSEVLVSGGSIALVASESVSMVGSSVMLTSHWGGQIELSAAGGATVVDSLRLSGAELSSVDGLGGLTVRSEQEDVQISAGRAVSVRGEQVSMVGERVLVV